MEQLIDFSDFDGLLDGCLDDSENPALA